MATRNVIFVKEEFYHIYNRGNDKREIFYDAEDYNRLVGLFYACNQQGSFVSKSLGKAEGLLQAKIVNPIVAIGAYCIMPNHFHILITELNSGGISKFMQKVATAYVMYYNKKYKRTGGLFEGKFKAKHCDSDEYLKYLFSYIHLNPVKLINPAWKEIGIRDKEESISYLKKYFYSSFLDYLGEESSRSKVINRRLFPDYFPNEEIFLQEIFDWMSLTPQGKT